jgi:hypothetical protein
MAMAGLVPAICFLVAFLGSVEMCGSNAIVARTRSAQDAAQEEHA